MSLAYWYRDQYYDRPTGDLDPSGELKRQVLAFKLGAINECLKKRGEKPIKWKKRERKPSKVEAA
jgi:hypothetical protein